MCGFRISQLFRNAGVVTILLANLTTTLPAGQPNSSELPSRKNASAQSGSLPAGLPTEDLVFLGEEHPVFVRLFASVDGHEVRVARAQRIAKAVKELDDNGDGTVDHKERASHPRALRSLGVPEKWSDLLPLVDRNPQDNLINSEEIGQFIIDRFGPSVTLVGKVRQGNQAVELFDLLDVDRDSRLTEAELTAIPSRLNKLDGDGDDAFSIVEVEPFRNPFGIVSQPSAARDELSWTISKTAANRLLAQYDRNPRDQSLSAEEIGQDAASVAAFDQDKSGGLTLDELKAWLPSVQPHYILTTHSFIRKAGRTELSWIELSAETNDSDESKPRRETAKSLEVKLAGLPLQLRQLSAKAGGRISDVVNLYKVQFAQSDTDKNKYLDQTEFAALRPPFARFELVDADENGQVYETELVDFLNLEAASEQNRVILAIDRNEQSLFSLLDRNRDQRLTPREVASTFDRWQAFDHDGDRILSRSELSGLMRMTVDISRPKLFDDFITQQSISRGDPILQSKPSGPIWFQSMDRNRDGDVSRREFLGTEAQFRKWDRDSDGFIGKEEVE